VMMVGVVVGCVGAGTGAGDEGRPGVNGLVLPGWAAAAGARASNEAVTRTVTETGACIAPNYASGCSIAGVSGAST